MHRRNGRFRDGGCSARARDPFGARATVRQMKPFFYLHCSDLELARRFYSGVLGLPEIFISAEECATRSESPNTTASQRSPNTTTTTSTTALTTSASSAQTTPSSSKSRSMRAGPLTRRRSCMQGLQNGSQATRVCDPKTSWSFSLKSPQRIGHLGTARHSTDRPRAARHRLPLAVGRRLVPAKGRQSSQPDESSTTWTRPAT